MPSFLYAGRENRQGIDIIWNLDFDPVDKVSSNQCQNNINYLCI